MHVVHTVETAPTLFGSQTVEVRNINKTRSKIIVTSPPGKGIVLVQVVGADGSVATVRTGFTYTAPEPPDDRCCGEDGKNPTGTIFRSPTQTAGKKVDLTKPEGPSIAPKPPGDAHKH